MIKPEYEFISFSSTTSLNTSGGCTCDGCEGFCTVETGGCDLECQSETCPEED